MRLRDRPIFRVLQRIIVMLDGQIVVVASYLQVIVRSTT